MRWFVVLALVVTGITGCGKSTPPENAPASQAQPAAAAKHPAGQAAHDFMNYVVQGDVDSATGMLTPRAIAQFESQEIGFVNPGLGAAKFEIGRVEQPAADRAMVQCLLQGVNGENSTAEEEVCWLMRQVDNRWLISGIAYDAGGADPIILDFENLPPKQPVQAQQIGGPQENPPAGQPPQTALQPSGNPVQ